MKQFFSIVLLSAFLLPQLAKIGVFVSFKANQDFIAKVLCINKDKPEMKCNGKCHLAKELNKMENKEEGSPITVTNKIEINLFIVNCRSLKFEKLIGFCQKESSFDIEQDYYPPLLAGIFHPPQAFLS